MNKKVQGKPSDKNIYFVPVVGIHYVSTPDASRRLHQAIDLLLNSEETGVKGLEETPGAHEEINQRSKELRKRNDKSTEVQA